MKSAPCLNCPDRKGGCHSICERYAEYDNERKEIRDKKMQESIVNGYESESIRRVIKRNKRR